MASRFLTYSITQGYHPVPRALVTAANRDGSRSVELDAALAGGASLALCSPRLAVKLRSGVILLLHIVMMALTAAAAWWLSGYDTKLTGEDKPSDRLRRGVRSGITVLLVEVAFSSLLRWWRYRDQTSGYVYLAVALPLGLTWASCLSEICARGFQRLVFPEDHSEADLGESRRSMDRITRLIQEGRREEAIDLCQQLRASGSASLSLIHI